MSDAKTAKETKKAVPASSKKRIIRLVIALVLILIITNPGLIPFLPRSLKNTLVNALSSLFGNVTSIVNVVSFSWINLFKLVVMILALSIIFEVVKLIVDALNPSTGRVKTLKNIFRSSMSYLFVLVGFFWGLSIIGVNVSTLFASVGIFALIIGFGAESLIEDLITGLFMIFENEYNVGDIVELSGYRGTVTEIGIRTTSVMDAGGNIKIINNSDMRNIINLSDKASRAVCDFAIPYEVKIADAEEALNKVIDHVVELYPEVFTTRPGYVGVQELGESAVILRVVAEVSEANRFTAARLLNRELKIGMEELGISCPYNQLVVHQA